MMLSPEAYGFLKIPMPVPPMIESAFRYYGNRQYVSLGFGAHGGWMADFSRDSLGPRSSSLATDFLLHPNVRPYTEAFQIEARPPAWLANAEVMQHRNSLANWASTARCLLLDRTARQFFVGVVNPVRTWLILRIVLRDRKMHPRAKRRSPELAERDLWKWLDGHRPQSMSPEFLKTWEGTFQKKQSASACFWAGAKLGLEPDALSDLMHETFG
jgi:hypothetical protein